MEHERGGTHTRSHPCGVVHMHCRSCLLRFWRLQLLGLILVVVVVVVIMVPMVVVVMILLCSLRAGAEVIGMRAAFLRSRQHRVPYLRPHGRRTSGRMPFCHSRSRTPW